MGRWLLVSCKCDLGAFNPRDFYFGGWIHGGKLAFQCRDNIVRYVAPTDDACKVMCFNRLQVEARWNDVPTLSKG